MVQYAYSKKLYEFKFELAIDFIAEITSMIEFSAVGAASICY